MANLLSVGSRGPEVVTLQTKLNAQLFPRPNLTADGIFGAKTKAAVIAFQRQAGILVDGIVGPQTRGALGMPNPGNPFTHRVSLHFRSIALTDVPFNTILSSTQEVYAQFGIKIEFGSGESLALSQAEIDKFKQVDGTCNWEITGGEFADLLNKGTPIPSGGIGVFFVEKFSEAINGCGGHLKNKPACIVAKAGTKFCTAHEVCHVLLTESFNPVHIDINTNLMHSVDLNRVATPTLTPAQVTQIKKSPLCIKM